MVKKILRFMGVGLVIAVIVHENKALFEIRKDLLKHNHWLKKSTHNERRSK